MNEVLNITSGEICRCLQCNTYSILPLLSEADSEDFDTYVELVSESAEIFCYNCLNN